MRRLNRLGAIVIGAGVALAVLAKGPISLERALTGALASSGRTNRALAETTDGSIDERDDIHLDILEPYVVLPVPHQKYGRTSEMFVELAITNQGQTPIEIAGRGLVAQLVAADGTVVPLQKTKESLVWCSPLYPGEIERLYAPQGLVRDPKSRQLGLRIYSGTASEWNVEGISPGTYQLSYAYWQPPPWRCKIIG